MLNTGGLLEKIKTILPNYTIVAPDMRGQGNSTYKNQFNRLEDLAEDVNDFLVHLKISKVTIIGTCLGGYVSAILAARYPEKVEALVLIGAISYLGASHMFGYKPKDYADAKNTDHFKYSEKEFATGDREGLRKFFDGFHTGNWVTAAGFEDLLTDIMKCKSF